MRLCAHLPTAPSCAARGWGPWCRPRARLETLAHILLFSQELRPWCRPRAKLETYRSDSRLKEVGAQLKTTCCGQTESTVNVCHRSGDKGSDLVLRGLIGLARPRSYLVKPKQMWAYASSNVGIASWHCGYPKLNGILNWTVLWTQLVHEYSWSLPLHGVQE